jgi:hypothetical protein
VTDLDLAENHEYVFTPGGKPAISVSRIAKLVDDGRSDALSQWARKLALAGENHIQVRDYKGDLGTRVHNHWLSWNKGEGADVQPDEMGYMDAAEKFRNERKPINLLCEGIVVNKRGFGGRFDDVSIIGDEIWGIDVKTGTLRDRENELQHAGYWNSELAEYDANGMLIGTSPLPPIKRWACLNLHADGTYHFVEYPKRRRGQKDIPIEVLQQRAWDSFCKLLEVYVWLHPSKAVAA